MESFQRRLDEEDKTLFKKRMRIALLYMALPLVLSFSLVDHFMGEEFLWRFFLARLTVIPVSLACLALYSHKWISEKHFHVPAYLFIIYLSILNTYFAWSTGGVSSSYYAGLNLVGIAAFGFLPWKARSMAQAAICLYGPWVICALSTKDFLNTKAFVPHFAFMTSTMFIAGITTYISYGLRKAELRSRIELEKQVKEREQIITNKTKEGVFMERLTNQFSPQVVDAIRTGSITLDTRVRKNITCIFIDVENSTNRSNRIDFETYSSLLSDFFTKCNDVFLQHNVTIGTYLGDGMMAFVNAPHATDNHREVAVNASVDLLRMHRKVRKSYKERWRTDFNIRIGINTGFASVGFFPSFTRGTYTAIGENVNLAARLCSKAPPNTICVTKAFIKEVANKLDGVVALPIESAGSMKGYESDNIELFSIAPVIDPYLENLDQKGYCPSCEQKLVPRNDLGGSILVGCPNCNYTDVVKKNLSELGAY